MKINTILLFCVLPFIFIPLTAQTDSSRPSQKSYSYSIHDIKRGERIFHGYYNSDSSVNCASCHNTVQKEAFSHYPSAFEIATKYSNKSFDDFKNAITKPSGKVMSQIHDNLQLTDEDIHNIKLYLNSVAKLGEDPRKPLKTNRLIFIALIIIFLGAFADFVFFHKIKHKYIHVAAMLVTTIFITKYIAHAAIDIGRSKGYHPDQPIKFSHKVHAGQNQINCLYCHFNAERSRHAGIPPLNVCNNCHMLVKEGSRSGKFEINKIYQALESNKPVEWVKVHNVPDYVYFNHAQHVVAGKLNCVTCHGDVAQMDEIVQVKDLSMGWCVNCHRNTNVQFDNKFYGSYGELHRQLQTGIKKNVTVEDIGGTDCMKCHY